MSEQIDTSKPFYLIGVSLGGMVATEINDILSPERVILISSAKCRRELPFQYRFQKDIPIYKIVPKNVIKRSTVIAQHLFEPECKKEKDIFQAMLRDKDPDFLKRTIGMIINWDRTEFDPDIVHIHGNHDNTLPVKYINYNHLIEDGSHIMVLTRSTEVKDLIVSIIEGGE